ncbi:MAG: UV DNA damage repair endonuclease UvsE [Simkania sp.]|nr:UV DNA damage repair endonuclease UvsE [Simkania sp.]
MIRLGLCCIFYEEPIKFRTTTAAYLSRSEKPYDHIDAIVRDNIQALLKAMTYCVLHNIGSFRINSQFLPLCSHPDWMYTLADLPNGKEHLEEIEKCRLYREEKGLRLVLHPDQFVVLNSPKKEVVESSIAELTYHAMLADLLEIDVINIHGGGVYGNKTEALARLKSHYKSLDTSIKKRLTFENDDKSYTPSDLLPICNELEAPFVYDVHHHRCLKDTMLIQEVTEAALKTWNREPLFHISSPLEGWEGPKPQRHHDFINPDDFPDCWKSLSVTVEIEAKAKEVAIQKLQTALEHRSVKLWKATT